MQFQNVAQNSNTPAVVPGIFIVCLVVLLEATPRFASACTSLVQDTPAGPVFASNLDLLVPAEGLVLINSRGIAKQNIRPGIDGAKARWVSKYGSVTFSIVGRGFAWSGMNERGLVISAMQERLSEYPKPDTRTPFDTGTWIQYLLDNCATIPEVIRAAARVRLVTDGPPADHFLMADATGQGAIIEYQNGEYLVYTGDELPVKALSNTPYGRSVESLQRGRARWWWSNPGRSFERFATAAHRMERFNPSIHANSTEYAAATLDLVSDQYTQWNVIYNIEQRKIWFRTSRNRATKYLSLADLDFSCRAPMRILDVHTSSKGDVARSFVPYNRSHNLDVFRTMCSRLGVGISDEDAVNLMRFYESFRCAGHEK